MVKTTTGYEDTKRLFCLYKDGERVAWYDRATQGIYGITQYFEELRQILRGKCLDFDSGCLEDHKETILNALNDYRQWYAMEEEDKDILQQIDKAIKFMEELE